MRTTIVAATMLILTSSVAFSQEGSIGSAAAVKPAIGVGSKSMDRCSADQRKFCATTPSAVMKECLVTHWNRIAGDCQDALATPIDRIGASGRRQGD